MCYSELQHYLTGKHFFAAPSLLRESPADSVSLPEQIFNRWLQLDKGRAESRKNDE
jgi:hypothetical protein